MKPKPQFRKADPPISGVMNCPSGHSWNVMDLNPERVVVPCPVCGGLSSIRQGFGIKK